MTFWRCAVLWFLVACGSKPATPSVERPTPPAPVAPTPAAATPVAVAFVLEGWEMWIGNDQIQAVPEDERTPGALNPFKEAFARVPMTRLPGGSMATVVTYGEHASVRHPMAPIAKLSAAAFGEQKDYAGVIDRDLVSGVTLGLDELAKVKGARRVLVVIGDGSDSHVDTAKDALRALAKRAAAENVQIVSLVYKAALSSPFTQIASFHPSVMTVNLLDALGGELEALFEGLEPQPVVAHVAGEKTVALALLVAGAEVWMGNDDIVPANDPARYMGALKGIRAALDRAPMTGRPGGSQGMILTYGSKVQTQQRLGPIEKLDARAMGDQRTYYGTVGTELVSGVRSALAQLAQVDAARRVLVIVGDGSDTNNEVASAQLRDLAKQAAERHIEVHAIVYKSALSAEETVIAELAPRATTATTSDELTTQLAALLGGVR
jgi:hypothetical protein